MHKSTTMVAAAVAALAMACDRPAGEDSAADQMEHRDTVEPAMPTGQDTQQPQQQQQPRAAADNVRADGELRVAEITANPDERVNQDVTVVGEVKDMLGERAFKLADESPSIAGQDTDIVVLGAQRAGWTMDDSKGDARMRVKGQLKRVSEANFERDLGWKLDDEMRTEIGGEQFVLIAQSVERLEGGEQQRAGERGDMPTGEERQGVRGEDQPQAP
jgi:hypothetical protein